MDPISYGYKHTDRLLQSTSATTRPTEPVPVSGRRGRRQVSSGCLYFDDHAGDSQMDLGVHMGLGSIASAILANYYNKSLTWNPGKPVDAVMNMKGVGGQYDSFQTNEALLRPARPGQEHRGEHGGADQRLSLSDRARYPGRQLALPDRGGLHRCRNADQHAHAERLPKRKPAAEPYPALRVGRTSTTAAHHIAQDIGAPGSRLTAKPVYVSPSVRGRRRGFRQHANGGLHAQQR